MNNAFNENSEIEEDKDEIVHVIQSITSVSEETAAAAEEVTASTSEQENSVNNVTSESKRLNDLAVSLNKEINKFKI